MTRDTHGPEIPLERRDAILVAGRDFGLNWKAIGLQLKVSPDAAKALFQRAFARAEASEHHETSGTQGRSADALNSVRDLPRSGAPRTLLPDGEIAAMIRDKACSDVEHQNMPRRGVPLELGYDIPRAMLRTAMQFKVPDNPTTSGLSRARPGRNLSLLQ